MNSRWQANKIGFINFWYYDEQEFPFVKGRMLLRGSNGAGKSVTMQSVVPLLLDGNMSPERLDPFGTKDRKMISYLLEENDEREERTGYLYLEFKRQQSDVYLTLGMGIRARKGKPLDKWYFSLTDGRRVGKDFFLYKDTGEKVTLSRRELENRVADGGRVFDRQSEYMEYVNRQVFGFETVEEYKEMLDLLIQLRTPKLSKEFKPSVINDILSDSLQPLSDEDLRSMSEAIENMDTMIMNLKSRREAYQAAQKINNVLKKYSGFILYDKAEKYIQAKDELVRTKELLQNCKERFEAGRTKVIELDEAVKDITIKKETLEKEKDDLNKSDVVALKNRENVLLSEIDDYSKIQKAKEKNLEDKEARYIELQDQIKDEENKKYDKEKELEEILDNMESDAEDMAFQEFAFMREELQENIEINYDFNIHRKDFVIVSERIAKGEIILAEIEKLNREKDEILKKRDTQMRELDSLQRKIYELEAVLVQVQNEWKERLFRWNEENRHLKLDRELLIELSTFADNYRESSDFAIVKNKAADRFVDIKVALESLISKNQREIAEKERDLSEAEFELKEWENQKEPVPPRSEAVLKNRKRLEDENIPYHEFYKVIEFGEGLDERSCNLLEEALMKMGILDAIVVEEQYREKVLAHAEGCEDRYLFAGCDVAEKSLLDVLELNDEVNDIFSNQRLAGILGSITYDSESALAVTKNGCYYMGALAGTVTGEYEAGYLGTKARERKRLSHIEECKSRIALIEKQIGDLKADCTILEKNKSELEREYEALPGDSDMREAMNLLSQEERKHSNLKSETDELSRKLSDFIEKIKDKKNAAAEIAAKLYLDCNFSTFTRAKKAADSYEKYLIRLASSHEVFLGIIEKLIMHMRNLDEMDDDLMQIRDDISDAQRRLRDRNMELSSVQKQLKLTDYESVKEQLDRCIKWLNNYPETLQAYVEEKTSEEKELEQVKKQISSSEEKVLMLEERTEFFLRIYNQEKKLGYVEIPEETDGDAKNVYRFLATSAKGLKKESLILNINTVYMENKGFLSEYSPIMTELFNDEISLEKAKSVGASESGTIDSEDIKESHDFDSGSSTSRYFDYSPQRIDIAARYQGIEVSFSSLLIHLEEDIAELENLIKDGDRELFEDILANTVSRKIRGKINASNMWVQKMNALMNSMDTSSSLKLSLRWRSKTAEKEDQLDTRELVELLKKDYRVMSEEEAEALSSHFKSKVEEARRIAGDSGGMVSFYQIMKETLDYRNWFEFELMSQKKGERQKELTNSVFGTFSGGEKAMAMYVPLFSAVVAKYQGGREDAPRLICLDEACAGVDNRNIRDMFRLMAQFGFDFIINSQVLWGDCDTLDALAIYQLVRPGNVKFVTVLPYLWNGFSKELLDSEEEVEQRGVEIGLKS